MVNPANGFFTGAFAEGLFLAILTKTGIDTSPSGIGLTILKFLGPYVNDKNKLSFTIIEIFLYVLPFFGFLAVYVHYGRNGLIIYGGIIIASYVFVLSIWIG